METVLHSFITADIVIYILQTINCTKTQALVTEDNLGVYFKQTASKLELW